MTDSPALARVAVYLCGMLLTRDIITPAPTAPAPPPPGTGRPAAAAELTNERNEATP